MKRSIDRACAAERAHGVPRATWWLLASLYTTQYLGLGFFMVALVAILRERGVPLEQLGMVYLLGMVWPLKFLWAPLVDKIGLDRWGHYRSWLILMQGGLVATFLVMGWLLPIDDFLIVYLLCLLVALLSATQDVAVDGLTCRLLSSAERGLGNGIKIAGNLLGNMLGGGLVLMAYPYLGWQVSMSILAVGTGVSLVQLMWFREPVWSTVRTSSANLIRRIGALWRRPGGSHWFMLLLLYPVGTGLAYALITPILVDADWGLERIGFTVNVLGSLLGVSSALLTGWLLRWIDRRKAVIGAAVIQIPGIVAIALPALGYADFGVTTAAVGLYFLVYNPAATVLSTLMMDRASVESPATDYAIQYGLHMAMAVGVMTVGTTLAGKLGYTLVLAIAALAAALAAILSLGYRNEGDAQVAVDQAETREAAAPQPALEEVG